jgi:hypothetical protein
MRNLNVQQWRPLHRPSSIPIRSIALTLALWYILGTLLHAAQRSSWLTSTWFQVSSNDPPKQMPPYTPLCLDPFLHLHTTPRGRTPQNLHNLASTAQQRTYNTHSFPLQGLKHTWDYTVEQTSPPPHHTRPSSFAKSDRLRSNSSRFST